MADMEQAVGFFREFLAREHEAEVVLWSELDEDVVARKLDELNACYAGSLASILYRPLEVDEAYFEDMKDRLDDAGIAVLFKVARYEHPRHGELFRAYASDAARDADAYFTTLFAKETRGKLKVIARYNLCIECWGSGKVGARTCAECKGSGWNWRGGKKLGDLGKPAEVRRLQAPARAQDRADYDAE